MQAEQLKQLVVDHNLTSDVFLDVVRIIPGEIVEEAKQYRHNRKGRPCPKCGGVNRFSIVDFGRGSILCRSCCRDKTQGSGDIIGAIMWARGCSCGDACKMLENYLKERHIIRR